MKLQVNVNLLKKLLWVQFSVLWLFLLCKRQALRFKKEVSQRISRKVPREREESISERLARYE